MMEDEPLPVAPPTPIMEEAVPEEPIANLPPEPVPEEQLRESVDEHIEVPEEPMAPQAPDRPASGQPVTWRPSGNSDNLRW